MKYRRIAVGVVFLCVLAASLEANFFVLLHVGHDCSGDACPVCALMKDADGLRRLLGGSLKPAAPIHHALLPLSVSVFLLKIFEDMRLQTLIAKKVRLNN